MEVVMTKERISAALVIETCRVDKGYAAHDVSHCEVNFQMQGKGVFGEMPSRMMVTPILLKTTKIRKAAKVYTHGVCELSLKAFLISFMSAIGVNSIFSTRTFSIVNVYGSPLDTYKHYEHHYDDGIGAQNQTTDFLKLSDVNIRFNELISQAMTKINDVEANLEQFKSETLAWQKETSNRFHRMQESIDKNKADADKQFSELLQLLKALQPPTTLPTTIPRFEENSRQCFSSDEVEKEELILMSMNKGDVTGPILAVKEDLWQKLIDDLDEPLMVHESDGVINKNEFAIVAPVVAVAPQAHLLWQPKTLCCCTLCKATPSLLHLLSQVSFR
ncbi:hypothetical protein Tco_0900618 [Tanacetum coccineum]